MSKMELIAATAAIATIICLVFFAGRSSQRIDTRQDTKCGCPCHSPLIPNKSNPEDSVT